MRRLCMLWFCKVKEWMVQRALVACRDKHVIMDLGSGNGQPRGLYSQVLGDPWSKTVLFVEKNEPRAAQLVKSPRRCVVQNHC